MITTPDMTIFNTEFVQCRNQDRSIAGIIMLARADIPGEKRISMSFDLDKATDQTKVFLPGDSALGLYEFLQRYLEDIHPGITKP